MLFPCLSAALLAEYSECFVNVFFLVPVFKVECRLAAVNGTVNVETFFYQLSVESRSGLRMLLGDAG